MRIYEFTRQMIRTEIIEGTQDIIITEGRVLNNIIFNGKAMDIYYGGENTKQLRDKWDSQIVNINAKDSIIYIAIR